MITALYVDDEPSLLDIAKAFLERDGELVVETSSSAMDALVRIETRHYDAVISDYQMPVVDGLQFLKTLRMQGRKIPFILFTGKGREDVAIEALNNGADFYLQKGGDPRAQFTELINMVKRSVEQRRAAEGLLESEEIYEKLFQYNVEAMILVDPRTGALADVNDAATVFFGHAKERLLKMNLAQLVPGLGEDGLWAPGQDRTRQPRTLTLPALAGGEQGREVEAFSGTLRVKGRQLGYAILHDVTEMRRGQRREERLVRVLKVMGVTSQLFLRARGERELLEGACRALVEQGGYLVARVYGLGARQDEVQAIAEAQRPGSPGMPLGACLEQGRLRSLSAEAMGTNGQALRRWDCARADGGTGGLAAIALPLASGGDVAGSLVIVSDAPDAMQGSEALLLSELAESISEASSLAFDREHGLGEESTRKQAEERLWETGSKLRAIIQTSPMAIVSLDPDGSVSTWNPAAERVFGWDEGGPGPESSPFDPGEESRQLMQRVLRGEALTDVPLRRRERTVSISSAPILDQAGRVISIIIVAWDITERKSMEDRMIQLNDLLRLVNRILRHDTLNELMVLSGSLDMYQKTKQERFLVTAGKAVNRSMEMIKRMRELESLAASGGETKLYDLRQVAENVLRGYMIEFSVDGEGSIYADDALPSALDNIVRNAMVHGRADRIVATIHKVEGRVVLRIADNGSGIPESVKKHVFEEGFSFGANAGTGLGLYLVTKAVERYGGRVSVEDNQPRGAVFVLAFPAA